MNPNGGIAGDEFELTTEASFASFKTLSAAGAGPGTSSVAVVTSATDLTSASTYYYRLASSNAGTPRYLGGGSATSNVVQFATRTPATSKSVTVGDVKLTLTAATEVCTASDGKLTASLMSKQLHKGAKVKLVRASFSVETGRAHNERVRVSVKLPTSGLKPGGHTLKVTITYTETQKRHGRQTKKTRSTTLKIRFSIC